MRSILTVTVPAETQDLTTIASAKRELGITDDSNDEHICELIRHSSSVIASYCDRVFGQETVREIFFPDRSWSSEAKQTLLLKRTPVIEIASITVDNQALSATDYRLDARAGLLYRMGGSFFAWNFWGATDGIAVDYTGGYQLLGELPFAIERAALILVKEYWNAVGRDPTLRSIDVPGLGRQDFTVGGLTTDASDLPPMVSALLAPYKRYA